MIGVLGSGSMAGAIVRGLAASDFDMSQVLVTDRSGARAPQLASDTGAKYVEDTAQLVEQSDTLVLGVKPHQVAGVLKSLRSQLSHSKPLVVSIAAGLTTTALSEQLPKGCRVVRAMPNVAAAVGASMTGVCGSEWTSSADVERATQIMGAVGQVMVIPESQMDVFTALAGCSPAWLAATVDALATAGVAAGMSKSDATRAVAGAMAGTAAVLTQGDAEDGGSPSALTPAQMVDQVCSPGGSTVAGLLAAESAGLRGLWSDAVGTAVARNRELGAK